MILSLKNESVNEKYRINIANKRKYGRIVLEIHHGSDEEKNGDINSELNIRQQQENCRRRRK